MFCKHLLLPLCFGKRCFNFHPYTGVGVDQIQDHMPVQPKLHPTKFMQGYNWYILYNRIKEFIEPEDINK